MNENGVLLKFNNQGCVWMCVLCMHSMYLMGMMVLIYDRWVVYQFLFTNPIPILDSD